MAERLHVHAELVRATRFRREFNAGAVFSRVVAYDAVQRERGFAGFEVDFVERTIGPVDDEWQIHFARCRRKFAIDQGDVSLVDLPVLKGDAQLAVHVLAARQDQQAGSVAIEAVHDQRVWILDLDAADQAILFFGTASGNGEQAAGLARDEQSMIGVDQCEARCEAGRVIRNCGL